MNDKGKIIFGLIIFLAAVTLPVWYNLVSAGSSARPEVELPAGEAKCVENREYMLANHMNLLDVWRNEVVRLGNITYTSNTYGDTYEMSLTRTCMKCHTTRATFCDKCHTYADVDPYCWDCHLEPKGEQ